MQSYDPIPKAFIDEVRDLLGGELPAFLDALEQPAALALRINPLRAGAEDAARPFCDGPVPWAEWGRYLKDGLRPGASLAHACGAFYLQEASAMASAAALDARPGERILDLCAAPGGKTSQIAAAMGGRGLLVSNEPVPARARVLAENLDRLGVANAVATNAYPDQLAARWPEQFDAVLVDAPCSGEGMFRREPASRSQWNPASPAGCARRQADILDAAVKMLRPGGRLVYSTCTFNRLEDEDSIVHLLDRHPELTPEEFALEGVGASQGGMLRLWPHRVRGDGHFVARLRKADGETARALIHRPAGARAARRASTVGELPAQALVERLEAESCRIPETLRDGILIRQGDYVHALPAQTPPLDGIRTARPGLCLLRAGRSHVQPMPALAMASRPDRPEWTSMEHLGVALRSAELDEDAARHFLDGARPELSGEPGWTLLTWNHLPLGFAKCARR